ncbi:MAG TPA: HupE/UreJ family protein [Myxococcales bacterium]|nr:HupE/UreJ family protein [Myxococcales bacterium]
MRLALLLALLPAAALAHQTSLSFSELSVRGRRVDGVLRFSLADLRTQLPVDPAALPAAALSRLLLEPFVLKASGRPCPLQANATAAMDGADGVALQATWLCPVPVDTLSVRVGFLDSFPIGHTHLSRIEFGPGEISQRVAQVEEPSFEARRSRSVRQEFARFLWLGVEHIFTGYDHIAFLIGLLLLGGSLSTLVKIVTAFTLAHSVTLALAALDVLAPSPRLVEPLIAVSIVFIGVENLLALRRGTSAAALRHRWLVTLFFGLVHGFGFASVLRELQLPRAVLATGLVSFNLGVECGQLVIVVVALPILARLRAFRPFAPAASACVAALGAIWLAQRLIG